MVSLHRALPISPYNPAFLHSADLAARGIAAGDLIEIVSAHGRVSAIASVDDAVKPGVVSLAHGWGALPGSNEDPAVTGTAVNALIDTDRYYEPINAKTGRASCRERVCKYV